MHPLLGGNIDIFDQKAFDEISNESGKLRTYSWIKRDAKREPYLPSARKVEDGISISKYRLSSHKLMTERGKYLNLHVNDRKCLFCHLIEDKAHLKTYANLINYLLDRVR